ncbi:MAG: GNAT family N-acetyltransferase [Hyphomicrobiaceae bacterium]
MTMIDRGGSAPKCSTDKELAVVSFPLSQPLRASASALPFRSQVASGVAAFERANWDALFRNSVFGWDFCRAAERAPPNGFHLSAVGVLQNGMLISAAPVFRTTYRWSTSLPPLLRRAGDGVARLLPRLFDIPIVGLGSPALDRCHIGFLPHLPANDRRLAWETLLGGLEQLAADDRSDLVAIKDLGEADRVWAEPLLVDRQFGRTVSLPVAVLDVPFTCERGYLASLSSSMRQDINRKLRQSRSSVRFELRQSIAGLEATIVDLYAATRLHRRADYGGFDSDSPELIPAILDQVGGRAHVVLGWIGNELASFSIFLLDPDCAYAYRIGMRYPIAREHNLYFLNWMMMVRICIDRGIRRLEMGQTCYPQKQRLGCRLERSWVYVRHQSGPVNAIIKRLAPLAGFDKMEAGAVAP